MNYAVWKIAGMLGAGFCGAADARVCTVTNDSRKARRGALFVALSGEHTDGHNYVQDAFRRGATAALVRSDRHITPTERGSLIVVEDPLTALYDLAARHGATHGAAVRIAISGSSGKTTTKEILGSILSVGSRSLVSEGSFNAEIGLPMSVLRMTGDERFVVLEVGINAVGEMERYAALAQPDHALITNIGSAHVGRIGGSRHDIAREKGALLRSVGPAGCVYVGEKEPFADLLLAGVRARVVRFGPDSTTGYERSESLGLDGWLIHWEGLQLRFSLPGRHNLENALAALTVAGEIGCGADTIAAGIEAVRPPRGRFGVHRGRYTVIDDGYNSNPESVQAALAVLGESTACRRVAVLGPMLDLGSHGNEAHLGLASALTDAGVDLLCCFGQLTRPLSQAFARAVASNGRKSRERVIWTESLEEISEHLRTVIRDGDLVLLKASRAFRIERLLPVLGVAEAS